MLSCELIEINLIKTDGNLYRLLVKCHSVTLLNLQNQVENGEDLTEVSWTNYITQGSYINNQDGQCIHINHH